VTEVGEGVVESIEMPREPRVCGALGLRHLALIGDDDDAGFPLTLCLRSALLTKSISKKST
jgi:hypothetical protein